jgi:ribosomal protein L40E
MINMQDCWVEKVLDKILINGKYDPLEDWPEATPEQKAVNRAEVNRMMGKATISCSRCGGKNPANSEHCYKCGQTIAGIPSGAGIESVLHEGSQDGNRSLGDLSGCDSQKLREELRDRKSQLDDKDTLESALDEPHHLIFYTAVDREGETRFFDIMPQGDGFSIAETATKAGKLGQCVETAYGHPGGPVHHLHRLYGKFCANTARKAMDRFSELSGLSQVTEIAETQTQREALPTWRFIYKKLGAVPRPNPATHDNGQRKDGSKTLTESNAVTQSDGTTKAQSTSGKLLKEEPSEKKSPSGIGGWLVFFIFGLFASGLASGFASLNMSFDASNAVAIGIGLVLAALAFSSAVLILRKNPRGILLSKVFIVSNLLVSILAVIGSVGDPTALGASSAVMGRVMLSSLIWITYLHQSVRVKNTFGVAAKKGQAAMV